VVETQDMKT